MFRVVGPFHLRNGPIPICAPMRDGEGRTKGANRSAAALAILTLVLLSALVLGGVLGWWPRGIDVESLALFGTALLFGALGPLILWKADGNRVGWVFSAIGLSILAAGITGGLADRGLLAFSAIGGGFWLGWIVGIGTLLLWFPTGRVPTRRWLWLQWLGFGLVVLTLFTYSFTDQVCVGEGGELGCSQWADNPIGIPGMPNPEYGSLSGPLFSFYPFFMGATLVSLIVRYRRSRSIERLQLKWFLLACFSFVAALVTQSVLELLGVHEPPLLVDVWVDLSIPAIPIAATLAILRYRLYEIDRIISRTVSYAIVIAVLGAVYTLGLTGLTSLLDTESSLAVAAVTLTAAALFNPLRKRVQAFVDHRFNRTRYDAERVMAGFTGSLRDEVDPDSVVTGWVDVVSETMRPVSAGVWLRDEA
jgi:hypothetical protein